MIISKFWNIVEELLINSTVGYFRVAVSVYVIRTRPRCVGIVEDFAGYISPYLLSTQTRDKWFFVPALLRSAW